jgi:cytochrome P450
MTEKEILGNSEILIVAGSETTATALSGITYYLGKNPRIMQLLVDEVRSRFSCDDEITMKTAAELTYLQACIEEGLRIFPPVVVSPTKLSPGDVVGGYYLPKNVSSSLNVQDEDHTNQ